MYVYVFLGMLYGHLIDDYVLQGILTQLKQKKYWEENAPNKMYKNDYIVGLICHSLEWSISIHIAPFLYILYCGLFNNSIMSSIMVLSIIVNACIHCFIDNAKANTLILNLVQDQLLHLLQIILTALYIGIIIQYLL